MKTRALEEFEKIILRDFLGANWSDFVDFCNPHSGDLADDIYEALGGERESD